MGEANFIRRSSAFEDSCFGLHDGGSGSIGERLAVLANCASSDLGSLHVAGSIR